MTRRKPKTTVDETQVWISPFPQDSTNQVPIDLFEEDRDLGSRQWTLLRYSTEAWPPEIPVPVFFSEYKNAEALKIPDIFKSKGSILMSERARDVFAGVDMGRNEMIEVPLLDFKRTKRLAGRWFALRVLERKEGIDLANSDTGTEEYMKPASGDHVLIHATGLSGQKFWSYRARSGFKPRKGVAVFRGTHEGVDLWYDPLLAQKAFFVTDRLYRALRAAKLKTRALHFVEAIMTGEEN
ncbi:MAG: hypothetical protein R3D60_10730 [Paracoccaceae bacterium]